MPRYAYSRTLFWIQLHLSYILWNVSQKADITGHALRSYNAQAKSLRALLYSIIHAIQTPCTSST